MIAKAGHTPVMVSEVVDALAPQAGRTYLDATFGAGGYATALLDVAACTVIGIDRDPEACARAANLCRRYSGRLSVLCGRFGSMAALLASQGIEQVDGVAFDLGLSSLQLDAAERGFSFRHDGPLDMRMDPDSEPTAADLVNELDESELAHLLFTYGGERAARRIAKAIVRYRNETRIERTGSLAEIIRRVLPRAGDNIDPATRTFQALRIRVNDELAELDRGLIAAERVLGSGGRLCVVSFHSLEDGKVKTFLRARSGAAPRASRHRLEAQPGPVRAPSFRVITRRAIRPASAEIAANPRARSARLRVAERTGAPPWPDAPEHRRAA